MAKVMHIAKDVYIFIGNRSVCILSFSGKSNNLHEVPSVPRLQIVSTLYTSGKILIEPKNQGAAKKMQCVNEW